MSPLAAGRSIGTHQTYHTQHAVGRSTHCLSCSIHRQLSRHYSLSPEFCSAYFPTPCHSCRTCPFNPVQRRLFSNKKSNLPPSKDGAGRLRSCEQRKCLSAADGRFCLTWYAGDLRLCRKTRSGFERLIFLNCFISCFAATVGSRQPLLSARLSRCTSGAASTIKPISLASVPSALLGTGFARRKIARSRADDGVFRQSPEFAQANSERRQNVHSRASRAVKRRCRIH